MLLPLLGHAEDEPETNVAVSVGKIMRTTLHSYVVAYGPIETSPIATDGSSGGVKLEAPVGGLVTAVPVVEGARVEKGALLVQMDAQAADAEIAGAAAAVDAAEKTQTRQRELRDSGGSSERTILEAQERLAAARGALATAKLLKIQLTLVAPISGVLTFLDARPGEWLTAGKSVAEVADLDRLVVSVQVPSVQADALRPEEPADIWTGMPGRNPAIAHGVVTFVSPRLSDESDSVLVRIALPPASGLRLGQFGAARITSLERAGVLAVPAESLVKTPDGGYALWVVEQERAKQRAVRTGLHDGALVEVSGDGLVEGMTVVTTGAYGLPAETKVTIQQP